MLNPTRKDQRWPSNHVWILIIVPSVIQREIIYSSSSQMPATWNISASLQSMLINTADKMYGSICAAQWEHMLPVINTSCTFESILPFKNDKIALQFPPLQNLSEESGNPMPQSLSQSMVPGRLKGPWYLRGDFGEAVHSRLDRFHVMNDAMKVSLVYFSIRIGIFQKHMPKSASVCRTAKHAP